VGLDEFANLGAMHADDFFKDGDEDAEGVGAEHGALGDLGDVFGFGDGDGETVAGVDVEHDVYVGAAVTGIDHVVGADFFAGLEFVEERDFTVTGGGPNDGVDFAGGLVGEFGAMNMIGGEQTFEGAADDFDRGGGEHEEIEMVAFDAVIENFVEQADIGLEANLFADLNEMFLADAGTQVGIMKEEIGEFGTLLDQIELGHAFGFAFEFFGGDADDFGEDIAGIVEGQGLVEIADEEIRFQGTGVHGVEHSWLP